jgi:hypothetical protein
VQCCCLPNAYPSPRNSNDFVKTCSSFDEYGYSIAELLDLDAHDLGVQMRGLSENELVHIMNAFFA